MDNKGLGHPLSVVFVPVVSFCCAFVLGREGTQNCTRTIAPRFALPLCLPLRFPRVPVSSQSAFRHEVMSPTIHMSNQFHRFFPLSFFYVWERKRERLFFRDFETPELIHSRHTASHTLQDTHMFVLVLSAFQAVVRRYNSC